jgi:hypothetical protein
LGVGHSIIRSQGVQVSEKILKLLVGEPGGGIMP